MRARPRSAYFPFGGGRHVCIGEGFVRDGKVALELSTLVELLPADACSRAVVPYPGVTLEPLGDVCLCLRAREHARRSCRVSVLLCWEATRSRAGDCSGASRWRYPDCGS